MNNGGPRGRFFKGAPRIWRCDRRPSLDVSSAPHIEIHSARNRVVFKDPVRHRGGSCL
jgi:hypothetical protein